MPPERNSRSNSQRQVSLTPQPYQRASPVSTRSADATGSVPVVTRRAHVKSKRGCRTCKRRKVKCDEQHPSCGNCIKHNVTCDFLSASGDGRAHPSYHLEATHASDASRTPSVAPVQHQSPHVPPAPPRLSEITQTQHDHGDLRMVDLQLLHTFTTFTYVTLSGDPDLRHMLRTTAITMAFNCEFLMRTILALSALHLAHFRRHQKDYYISVGLSHYQVASRLATRRMDHLDHLQREDCEHLHLFAVLTMFFALASPKQDQNSLVIGDAVVPSWLTMLRSAEPILSVLDPKKYKGILSPLFSYGTERWRVVHGDSGWSDSPLMADLQTAINESCAEPELLSIYNKVIDHLRMVLARLVPNGPSKLGVDREVPSPVPSSPASFRPQPTTPAIESWDIFVWQWATADEFFPLLRGSAPRQEALAIYAHFLIMLKKLEGQWWLEGWATYLLEGIWKSLDSEHRSWIQWPIQELGWIPP